MRHTSTRLRITRRVARRAGLVAFANPEEAFGGGLGWQDPDMAQANVHRGQQAHPEPGAVDVDLRNLTNSLRFAGGSKRGRRGW